MLTFTIPEMEDQQDSEETPRKYTRNATKKPKEEVDTVLSIHAIPVYDGSLVKSENDLAEYLQDNGDLIVELVNDFELPWITRKASLYPKYKSIRRKKRSEEGEDFEDEDENDDNEEEEQQDEEEEEDDEQSEP